MTTGKSQRPGQELWSYSKGNGNALEGFKVGKDKI
jgi:hypothetical protein